MALRDKLRLALDEDEREEQEQKLDARLGKIEKKIDTIERAPGDDDEEELAALVKQLKDIRAELAELKQTDGSDPPKPKPKPEPKPEAKMRPGRKNGSAYDWDVDDDGNVRKLDIARIYSGEDEPDEVELPEAASA